MDDDSPAGHAMRVVFMSGYNQERASLGGQAGGALLREPFSAETLLRTIRDSLNAKGR